MAGREEVKWRMGKLKCVLHYTVCILRSEVSHGSVTIVGMRLGNIA